VAVAFGHGLGWVLSYPRSSSPTVFDPIAGTAALWQVDPSGGHMLGGPIRLHGSQPIALTVKGHDLWIADYAGSTITRVRLVPCHAWRREAPLPRRFLGVAIGYPAPAPPSRAKVTPTSPGA
jgi:hypothetical protein